MTITLLAFLPTKKEIVRPGKLPATDAYGCSRDIRNLRVARLRELTMILVRRYNLVVTCTTGGGHAAFSHHYVGQAVDLSGSYGMMWRACKYLYRSGWYKRIHEGIHKYNLSVYSGRSVGAYFWGIITWNNHRNHIHIAMAY